MSTSIIDLQRDLFLQTIKATTGNDWKVLVVDQESKSLLYNVTKEDDILNTNITNIESIEDRRQSQLDTDAIYLLSPLPHIVECLKADLARKRYRRAFLIWTSVLPRHLGEDLFQSESRKHQIADSRSLNIDFHPKESSVVTFRQPWSFQILFNPSCDALVKGHLDSLTQKIVSVCVSLGEYPLVKYYNPEPTYEASVLCSHLATFVQQALDDYARNSRNNFPPQSSRPRATLIVTDRSMDLMSPLVHELTYQAMAMDLLPIQDTDDKMTYRNIIRRGQPDQQEKDVEVSEKDKIWVENRHLHMKDLLVKLSSDFKKFQAKNPQFADADDGPVSVNTIKDMLAGLPEFQEGKEAFSLHIDMAEKCAHIFQENKLMDLTSVEQSLATGLDEDNRKPKNLADQLVRLLDDDSVNRENRVRLLIMYVLYRNGILAGDIEKLRNHGQLSPIDSEAIYNLAALGAKVQRSLQEVRQPPPQKEPLFPTPMTEYEPGEEVSLSRFEPALKYMLEAQCNGTLDPKVFRAVKPHLDNAGPQAGVQQVSLRSAAQPTWAKGRSANTKPKQRIIVFMAGGATYAEARACYAVSQQMQREVYLATTHMLTPKMFLRQVSVMRSDRRELRLPLDKGPPQLPAWMSDPPPQSLQKQPTPQGLPSAQNGRTPRGSANTLQQSTSDLRQQQSSSQQSGPGAIRPAPQMAPAPASAPVRPPAQDVKDSGKVKKEKKEKKHLGLFKRH